MILVKADLKCIELKALHIGMIYFIKTTVTFTSIPFYSNRLDGHLELNIFYCIHEFNIRKLINPSKKKALLKD